VLNSHKNTCFPISGRLIFVEFVLGTVAVVVAKLVACPSNCSHVQNNPCNRVRPSAHGGPGAFHPSKNDLAFLGIITLNFVRCRPDL